MIVENKFENDAKQASSADSDLQNSWEISGKYPPSKLQAKNAKKNRKQINKIFENSMASVKKRKKSPKKYSGFLDKSYFMDTLNLLNKSRVFSDVPKKHSLISRRSVRIEEPAEVDTFYLPGPGKVGFGESIYGKKLCVDALTDVEVNSKEKSTIDSESQPTAKPVEGGSFRSLGLSFVLLDCQRQAAAMRFRKKEERVRLFMQNVNRESSRFSELDRVWNETREILNKNLKPENKQSTLRHFQMKWNVDFRTKPMQLRSRLHLNRFAFIIQKLTNESQANPGLSLYQEYIVYKYFVRKFDGIRDMDAVAQILANYLMVDKTLILELATNVRSRRLFTESLDLVEYLIFYVLRSEAQVFRVEDGFELIKLAQASAGVVRFSVLIDNFLLEYYIRHKVTYFVDKVDIIRRLIDSFFSYRKFVMKKQYKLKRKSHYNIYRRTDKSQKKFIRDFGYILQNVEDYVNLLFKFENFILSDRHEKVPAPPARPSSSSTKPKRVLCSEKRQGRLTTKKKSRAIELNVDVQMDQPRRAESRARSAKKRPKKILTKFGSEVADEEEAERGQVRAEKSGREERADPVHQMSPVECDASPKKKKGNPSKSGKDSVEEVSLAEAKRPVEACSKSNSNVSILISSTHSPEKSDEQPHQSSFLKKRKNFVLEGFHEKGESGRDGPLSEEDIVFMDSGLSFIKSMYDFNFLDLEELSMEDRKFLTRLVRSLNKKKKDEHRARVIRKLITTDSLDLKAFYRKLIIILKMLRKINTRRRGGEVLLPMMELNYKIERLVDFLKQHHFKVIRLNRDPAVSTSLRK